MRIWLAAALVPWLVLPATGSARAQVACPQPWSSGSPAVKAQHIFCGEINAKGRAVGFHSRPGGRDPDTVSDTQDRHPDPRQPGVYTISRFRISERGRTEVKTLSTMFPDRCDKQEVIEAIQHAYKHGNRSDGSFSGPSGPSCTDDRGQPFRIRGFTGTSGGRLVIVTAYPN